MANPETGFRLMDNAPCWPMAQNPEKCDDIHQLHSRLLKIRNDPL